MLKYYPLALFFSLTTCATLPSQARINSRLLEDAWAKSSWVALFQGVYHRLIEVPELPLRLHLLRVHGNPETDLVLTSPGDDDNGWTRPQTVRDFAVQNSVQIAVNAAFYLKRDHEPSVKALGLWLVEGEKFKGPHPGFSSFAVTTEGRQVILDAGDPLPPLRQGIGGGERLLRGGMIVALNDEAHPRTALGLSGDGGVLFLAVADGRQHHSAGIGLRDLAQFLYLAGAKDALNLDGGGSSTLVIQARDGTHRLLNSPWDNRLSGGERAVVNHIGIRASFLP